MTCMVPVNTLLNALRSFDEKLDMIIADIGELNRRATLLEENVARLHQDYAGLQLRMDRIESRLDGIRRTLDAGGADR